MGGVTVLRQTLAQHKRLFCDTMVFAYLLDAHALYADLAAAVLHAIEQNEVQGVTSTITLAELLTAPAQAQDPQAMIDYEIYLTNFPNLTIYTLDVALARETAHIRAATHLPTPDAAQIAAARLSQADAIVTNDRRWRNKVAPLTLILLSDYV